MADIYSALVAGGAAVFGAAVASTTNYLLSQRLHSRSAGRLLADLQILEKAKAVGLDEAAIRAIEARVQETLERHTGSAVSKALRRREGGRVD